MTLNGFTEAPGALPILGHTLPFMRERFAFLDSLPRVGDLALVRLGPRITIVVVCDPELTRQVLRDDQAFDKTGRHWDKLRRAFGAGMATSPRATHRPQRQMAQASFSTVRFPGYAPELTAQTRAAISTWRDGQVLDVPTEMLTLATRVVLQTFFSRVPEPDVLRQTVEDLRLLTAEDTLVRQAAYPPIINRLPTAANRRFRRASERMRQAISNLIAERRACDDATEDLLSAMLATGNPSCTGAARGRQGVTDDMEVCDQVLSFLVAGTESVAKTLSWTLSLLARHPETERRMHAEVDSVLAGSPAALEHLSNLEVTSHIITETLRLYPPAWGIPRCATRDTRLGNHLIPAGTTILISPYLIHWRADLYDTPGAFDPDRWDPARQRKPPSGAYIPFGGGARKCIGDRFAQVEATILLATIASRWRLESTDGGQYRPITPALSPHGLRLRARLR